MAPRTVSVTGYKNSGKTTVVEALVRELTDRGFNAGTIKHTADDVTLDSPGKDTERHRRAGSRATGILQENGAAFFIDEHLTLQQAAERLGSLDLLVIEGFKTLDTHARIIVPRDGAELEKLSNGLEIAVVKTGKSKLPETTVPAYTLDQVSQLADVVLEKAYPLLPGLDCHGCGYDNCKAMGQALLAGEAEITQCVGYGKTIQLKVNDMDVPLNKFTAEAIKNVVKGFIKTLKGGEHPRKVSLTFEDTGDE